jgi:Zn2+/Cd2+-exporting ATPase
MTAITGATALDAFDTADFPLTASRAKWSLGLRMLLSMIAAGLLCVAVLWRVAFPDEQYLSDLVAGGAAVLVTVPVLSAGWNSVIHPTLHGMTCWSPSL